MLDECPNCDAMVPSLREECKCGFKFERKKKNAQFCEYGFMDCTSKPKFSVGDAHGNLKRVCAEHYEILRPKSDIDLEMEYLAEKFKEEVKKSVKNGNFKSFVSSLIWSHP